MEKFQQLINNNGVSLECLGIKETALYKEDALLGIRILAELNIVILGGDVYFKADEKIYPAYGNWFIEKKTEENYEDYLKQSYEKASDYINNFPVYPDKINLFSLIVPNEKYEVPILLLKYAKP